MMRDKKGIIHKLLKVVDSLEDYKNFGEGL